MSPAFQSSDHEQTQGTNSKLSKLVDPVYAEYAFQRVIEEQEDEYTKHPRRSPVRVRRVWDTFRGRETEPISLTELAVPFAETKDPERSAQTAISWLNRTFGRLGLNLEVERSTYYRLRYRRNK